MFIGLKIDNVDRLPNGGPLSYRSHNRGFDIGRESRDWTLPDPDKFISGRHCEVRYEGGAFWLYDVSRNGTFVNGASQRIASPYRLGHGDRLRIGRYIVSVSIGDEPIAPMPAENSGSRSLPKYEPEPGNRGPQFGDPFFGGSAATAAAVLVSRRSPRTPRRFRRQPPANRTARPISCAISPWAPDFLRKLSCNAALTRLQLKSARCSEASSTNLPCC